MGAFSFVCGGCEPVVLGYAPGGRLPAYGHPLRLILHLRGSIAVEHRGRCHRGGCGSRVADRLGLCSSSRIRELAADSTPNALLHAKESVPIPCLGMGRRKCFDYWCRIRVWVGMVDGLGDGEPNALHAQRGQCARCCGFDLYPTSTREPARYGFCAQTNNPTGALRNRRDSLFRTELHQALVSSPDAFVFYSHAGFDGLKLA